MSITKGDFAQRVLKRLGINGLTSEADTDQVQDVLKMTENWFSSNSGIGRRVSWFYEEEPNPDAETGLPSWAIRGSVAGVAVDVSDYFDIEPSSATLSAYRDGMNTIMARTIYTKRVRYPSRMPRGRGNQQYNNTGAYYDYEEKIQTFNDFLEDEGGGDITT